VITYPQREGQAVTYHGSHTQLHGQQLTAHICRCRRAHPVEAPRYELRDTNGRWLLRCVRPRSITPA
jgi:hypothetical protein